MLWFWSGAIHWTSVWNVPLGPRVLWCCLWITVSSSSPHGRSHCGHCSSHEASRNMVSYVKIIKYMVYWLQMWIGAFKKSLFCLDQVKKVHILSFNILSCLILCVSRNRGQSPRARRLSALDEDFFDFSNTGLLHSYYFLPLLGPHWHVFTKVNALVFCFIIDSESSNLPGRSREYNIKNNLGFVGDFTPGVFRPHLEHVDTSLNVS